MSYIVLFVKIKITFSLFHISHYMQVDVMVGSIVIPFISYTKIPIDASVCNMSTNIISNTYAHSTSIVSQTPTKTKTETGKWYIY